MKRLIYITYLGLLALILISCNKETITPDGALAATPSDEARFGSTCRPYFYMTKTGVQQLGATRTDYLLIGFKDNVTPAQQETLLSQYAIFGQLDGDYEMESGFITIIKLNTSATCSSVETMMASLRNKTQVKFVYPVFNDPKLIFDWIGPSNEVMVTLKNAAYKPLFAQLLRATNCTIVSEYDLEYLISVNKNSTADALQMTTIFNISPYVDFADPNFVIQNFPLKTGKPERKLSKALLNTQAAL